MYVGTQNLSGDNWDAYKVLPQLGVNHVSANPSGNWLDWDADSLSQFREKLASLDISLDMMILPLASGTCENPRRASRFSSVLAQNGIGRLTKSATCSAICRGRAFQLGVTTSQFSVIYGQKGGLDGAVQVCRRLSTINLIRHWTSLRKGPPDADEMWERIDYFLSRVVPVAEEYKVRLACHPQDPSIGRSNYIGALPESWVQLKVSRNSSHMHESPYHGLNFCIGTVSESLEDPGRDIHDIIRYFGERKEVV